MAKPFAHTKLKTPWSAIVAAQGGDPALRRECLEYLFGLYREPIRRYIQLRLGRYSSEPDDDADDLTQNFLLHLLERPFIEGLDKERGSFRNYLATAIRNFVVDSQRQAGRNRPDGVLTRLARYDTPEDAEARAAERKRGHLGGGAAPALDTPGDPTPEELFMREWAQALMKQAVEVFCQDCADRGLPHYFAVFERHLARPDDFNRPTYRDSAEALGLTEKDVSNHLHRATKQFRQTLREVVRGTVATEEEVEAELNDLRRYFTGVPL